jgi:hypothetical protein
MFGKKFHKSRQLQRLTPFPFMPIYFLVLTSTYVRLDLSWLDQDSEAFFKSISTDSICLARKPFSRLKGNMWEHVLEPNVGGKNNNNNYAKDFAQRTVKEAEAAFAKDCATWCTAPIAYSFLLYSTLLYIV